MARSERMLTSRTGTGAIWILLSQNRGLDPIPTIDGIWSHLDANKYNVNFRTHGEIFIGIINVYLEITTELISYFGLIGQLMNNISLNNNLKYSTAFVINSRTKAVPAYSSYQMRFNFVNRNKGDCFRRYDMTKRSR